MTFEVVVSCVESEIAMKLIFQSVREKTGYSLSDIKEALEATKYDAEKAIAVLQKKYLEK